jgi:soluble lytic murein transglycosylase-like protein
MIPRHVSRALMVGACSVILLLVQLLTKTAAGPSTAYAESLSGGGAYLSASAQSELKVGQERIGAIMGYANRYHIPAPLAAKIYDHAVAEQITPDLGFRLVRVESEFAVNARSKAPAIGLTQLMVETASHYQTGVTENDLYAPDLNLQIGFRYLRGLIRDFHGDVTAALEAYNRGPVPVALARANGEAIGGVYSRAVLRK